MARSRIPLKPIESQSKEAIGPGQPIPGVSQAVEREVALLATETLHRQALLTEQLETFTEQLLIEGTDLTTIARLARQDNAGRWPHCTVMRISEIRQKIYRRWKDEQTEDLDALRKAMIDRLSQYRREARARRPPDMKTVLHCERQIAALQGLIAPKKHEVDVSGTIQQQHLMAAVIANYDPEDRERMLEEQREMERLAEAARNLLPALGKTGSDDGE